MAARDAGSSDSGSIPSGASHSFYQRRVAAFALAGTLIGMVAFVLRPIVALVAGVPEAVVHPVTVFHLMAFGSLALAWLLLRDKPRSRGFIAAVEHGSLLGCCIGFVGIGAHLPLSFAPETIMPFGFGMVLIVRAIFVPSSARRTRLIALVTAPLIVGTSAWVYATRDVTALHYGESLGNMAIAKPAMTGVFWIMIMMITTGASRVIYGLRRQIRDARRLGQYTLERKLGAGGMGEVYQASHAMLRRPAAVKLLLPGKIGDDSIARFEREVQLTARLTHFNTVTVFDYGRTPDGIFYYVMELIDGLNLLDAVAVSGPLPAPRVIHILEQAAGALAEAHGIGLIHRDIKPANIMLCRRGGVPDVVKVVDFGLVKELSGDVTSSLTNAATIQGTPQYMSPEAIRNPNNVGPAADLYALGAVGCFLLTGQHLFSGNVVEVCSHHLHTRPEPPSSRAEQPVPAELDALLLRCLAKDPTDRPESAAALQAELRAMGGAQPWTNQQAAAWWDQHAADIAHRAGAPATGSSATMAVDLSIRG